MNQTKRILHILIAVAAFVLLTTLLPDELFSREARFAIATIMVMIYWWIARPVHIAVTALLPILINSLFNIADMKTVLDDYFSPIVVLLIGAGVIVACWKNSGLDKRIALRALTIIGTSVRMQLIIWFVLSTLLSMFLPNVIVAAMLCPIAVAMIKFTLKDNDTGHKKTLYAILLSIVWGAGLGGFGTPLGGAMNLVAIEHIEKLTGQEYMYITWTINMMPYLLILAAGTCAYLLLMKSKVKHLGGSRDYFRREYQKIGKAKRSEIISLVLFIVAVVLAFARPLYAQMLPGFKPFYGFLLMGMAAFFLPGEKASNADPHAKHDTKRLITWDFAVKNINWGLIILFSGGLAVGNLLISTGAAQSIAQGIFALNITSFTIIVIVFIVFGIFLANASSNTAATAVLLPIVISTAVAMKIDPMASIYIAAAACNCAFILPTSIRAIPVGYGLDVSFMFKKGLVAVAICLLVLVVAALIVI